MAQELKCSGLKAGVCPRNTRKDAKISETDIR